MTSNRLRSSTWSSYTPSMHKYTSQRNTSTRNIDVIALLRTKFIASISISLKFLGWIAGLTYCYIVTYCYIRNSMVGRCVCLVVTFELCKNSWTDRDAVWGLSCVSQRNHVSDEVESRKGKGNLGGSLARWKALEVIVGTKSQNRSRCRLWG